MKDGASNRIFFLVIIAIVIATAFILSSAPKPIDWTLSFSKQDTKPFGAQLLYDLLPTITEDNEVKAAHSSIANYYDDLSISNTNIIIINNDFNPEPEDAETLLQLVENGNTLFLSANTVCDTFATLLNIESRQKLSNNFPYLDSVSLNLANRKLRTHLGYWYKKKMTDNSFASYDTIQTSVLGINNSGKTNFIRIQRGEGNIYLNLNPIVFTNYHLLEKDNYEYAFKCLSYLPKQTTIWDEHYKYKYIREQVSGGGERSILDFILQRRPLKIAWYLLLFGTALFFIFESARRQRVVPISKPLTNSTISFIETIGRLYFSRKNHLDIAQKRFSFLQEFIRSKYYINTSEMNGELYQQLSEKSAIPIRAIKQLFDLGYNLKKVQALSEEDLEQFNRRIEYFYEQCQ